MTSERQAKKQETIKAVEKEIQKYTAALDKAGFQVHLCRILDLDRAKGGGSRLILSVDQAHSEEEDTYRQVVPDTDVGTPARAAVVLSVLAHALVNSRESGVKWGYAKLSFPS